MGAADDAILRLHAWLVAHNYEAYDPFDGLSAWLRPIARTPTARQLLQQGVRRLPRNVRPLLGIGPARSSKGTAYISRAYLKLDALGGRFEGLAHEATHQLSWLIGEASAEYSGLCWGNHFDYQSRGFYLPKGRPTVVWTALCCHAYLDAWESLGDPAWLTAAISSREFILHDLERRTEGEGAAISYIPGQYLAIHNASMLAAGCLARLDLHSPNAEAYDVARRAAEYTCACQHSDGSWWYGEEEKYHWVDSFHTGYVLDSLWWYMIGTGDTGFVDIFRRGASFYAERFFSEKGFPRYYANGSWPVDIQCAAQGIETLTLLGATLDSCFLDLAQSVAAWTVRNMQDPDGHFYFRRWPLIVDRTPMLHWGQATMLHALACLLTAQQDAEHGVSEAQDRPCAPRSYTGGQSS